MTSRIFFRLLLGAFAGVIANLAAHAVLNYTGDLDDITTRELLWYWFGWVAATIFLGFYVVRAALFILISTVFGFIILAGVQKAQAIAAAPDLNGDGLFTIRDFGIASLLVIFETGERAAEIINGGAVSWDSAFVRFLEFDPTVIEWIAKVGLTGLVWFTLIGWAVMAWNTSGEYWENGRFLWGDDGT